MSSRMSLASLTESDELVTIAESWKYYASASGYVVIPPGTALMYLGDGAYLYKGQVCSPGKIDLRYNPLAIDDGWSFPVRPGTHSK